MRGNHAGHTNRPAFRRQTFGPVEFIDEWAAVEKLAVRPIEDVVEAVAIRLNEQLSPLSSERRVDEHRNLDCIPVVHIVRRELEIPLQLAGIGIERNHAFGIEVVTFPYFAIEIGRGIADSPVNKIQFRVVAAGQPCVAAAGLPRVSGPCFASRLARLWDRVPSPQPLAGFRIIGIQKTVQAMIAGRDAHDDLAFDRERRDRAPVAVACFRELRFPDETAGARVERNEVRIRRADIYLVAEYRNAAVRSFAQRGLMMVLPDKPAAAAVERVDFVRLRHVHDAIDDDRHALQPAGARDVIHPVRPPDRRRCRCGSD